MPEDGGQDDGHSRLKTNPDTPRKVTHRAPYVKHHLQKVRHRLRMPLTVLLEPLGPGRYLDSRPLTSQVAAGTAAQFAIRTAEV